MTAKFYRFTIEGSGAGGQTFITTGRLTCEFHFAFDQAMSESFKQLTAGLATYGQPGVGCSGPYDIHKLLIEQVKQ